MKPRTNTPDYPVTTGQVRTIKLACRALGISRETEHDMLDERYGVRSCTKLTFRQAGHFIQELESKGFTLRPNANAKPKKQQHPRPSRPFRAPSHEPRARPQGANVVCLVTPEEIDKINQVAALIIWRVEGGLALFLEKRMGIKGGRVKTSAEAYLAIEGLKKMFENWMKKQHGPAWWTMTFESPAIMEYIAIHKPAEWR